MKWGIRGGVLLLLLGHLTGLTVYFYFLYMN